MLQKKTTNTQNKHKIEKFNEFSPEVLKAVANLIEKNFTTLEIIDILKLKSNINIKFKPEDHIQGLILKLFNKSEQDDSDLKKHKHIIKIIEKFMHPISHLGDTEKTNAFREQIANILWHSDLIVEEDENRNYVILNVGESDIFSELKHDRMMEKHPYREENEIPSREEQMLVLKRKIMKESKPNENNQIHISYNINIGQFVFNGKEIVNVTGNQKNVSDCLVEAGENIKVSWDQINEKITGNFDEKFNDYEKVLIKKTVHGAVTQINKKTEKYLKSEKPLIDFKESEYWFQYPIDKNG